MSKFNTHGGYFAPTGYFRVDTGGSHDENPNGGVQVGVAPDGAPNLLEQDEPVYNDYVYSDNITADKDILAKHNIPQKYAGKLFSEIADTFVDEAEERPLDPVSNETLNAMLVRLADAQEEQKMIAEQKEIQDEIDNLSPEELTQLEAMLSQQEQVPQEQMQEQQMMSPEMYMQPDVAVPQQSGFNPQELAEYPGQIPIGMACGGTMLRKYACGGKKYKCGGNVHRYDKGGYRWNDFYDTLNNYDVSTYAGNIDGKYRIDRAFNIGDFANIKDYEASDAYRNFTKYVLDNSDDPNVQRYLNLLDERTGGNVLKLFNNGVLRDGWRSLYENRRQDGLGGIYHFNPIFDANEDSTQRSTMRFSPSGLAIVDTDSLNDPDFKVPDVPVDIPDEDIDIELPDNIRTRKRWFGPFDRRYIEPIMRGGLALYNALQQPDRYNTPRYHPVLPNGRMDLIDPVFNPMDENMAVNNVLAASSGATRALGNSGLGPSIGATLLAQDYNTGRNIGNAQTSVWDANNQRRNAVIAARNQNGVSQANFDYGVNRDRANILNDARIRNIQIGQSDVANNYAAESAQWNAVSSQLEAMGKALSDIAQEDRNRNLANQYSDLYGLLKDFTKYYKG